MRGIPAAAVAAMIALAPTAAPAQERAGPAAVGAVSGAIVLGPVGAVAGALIGYTAGPAISRSWGLSGSQPRPAKPPAARTTASKARAPTQAARPQSASAQTATPSPAPPAARSAQSNGSRIAMPPVQTLE